MDVHSGIHLNNGVRMPRLGLGTYLVSEGPQIRDVVAAALDCGYRSFDTAAIYGNETGLGAALAASGIARSELFVTTKVWNSDHGYERTMAACHDSLRRLGMDFVDLYLVHWPNPAAGRLADTWRAMERIYEDGKARAIGVSNFLPHHLDEVAATASVVPAVNQVELHPHLQQRVVRKYCAENGIVVEAWSPLKKGAVASMPELAAIAANHSKSPMQVALRWMTQHDIVPIPKSVEPQRIASNADIWDFTLAPEEMRVIDAMERDERTGPHPDRF